MGRTSPPQTETVPVVIKKLLQERIPRYRLLLALGPALWPNCLKIWQSSQVERTQFFRILTKLVLESDKIGPTSSSLLFPGPEILLTMRGWLLLELGLGELSPILLKHWFFPLQTSISNHSLVKRSLPDHWPDCKENPAISYLRTHPSVPLSRLCLDKESLPIL